MFYSEKFSFDGITNKQMSVELVSMDGTVLNEHGLGLTRTIESIGKGNNKLYSLEGDDTSNIYISLCYVNRNIPAPWTLEKRVDVIEWFTKDEFKPFISEDEPELIYFLKCVGYRKELDSQMRGVITFEMKPYSPYGYVYRTYNATVTGSLNLDIENISNIKEVFYPIFKIHSKANQRIYINEFELDVTEGEEITIDNKTKNIVNSLGNSILSRSNRKWVGLEKGINDINLSGKFDIEVECLFPLMV